MKRVRSETKEDVFFPVPALTRSLFAGCCSYPFSVNPG